MFTVNYCTELLILKFNFQTAREENIYQRYIRIHPIDECIILNDKSVSNQNASKRKLLDKNEATPRNIDKTKTDVYKLCGVIIRFNYEKSYAEFSFSSKKEVGSNFPAQRLCSVMRKDIFSFHYHIHINPHNRFMRNPVHP